MKEIEAKPKFPNAWKYGLTLSLLILVLASVESFFKSCSLESKKETRAAQSPRAVVRKSIPPICGNAENVSLTEFAGEVGQQVHPKCVSGLVFLPDLPMDLIAIDAPGKVSICLWNNDSCVDWVYTSDRNYQEKKKSEIPAYSAIRLMGDEGIATIKILNNRSL